MVHDDAHISRQMLDRFCVVGINYDKANIDVRGAFSVSETEYPDITEKAKARGLKSLFVLSTCNRTEMYGYVSAPAVLADILVESTKGEKEDLLTSGYHKQGKEAIQHLFKVATGLDSQILGDYEILGQLKRAVEVSKSLGMIGPMMDRVLNFALQASKKVKTETQLSHGTVSVSFAAINVLQGIENLHEKQMVLIGTGKFGTNVCNNLKTYLRGIQLTIINRTDSSAAQLAGEVNAQHCLFAERDRAIRDADVIIVCTNAQAYTVSCDMVNSTKPQLLLDLSVPANIDPSVKDMSHITLIDVDQISTSILDKTLTARRAEVPKALTIIDQYLNDFLAWVKDYRYALHLKNWREKLQDLNLPSGFGCEFAQDAAIIDETAKTQRAQKALKQLAINLKERNDKGCLFINSINDYLEL